MASTDERIAQLEVQVRRLIGLAQPERDRFSFLCLEINLTAEQEQRILDLMDEVSESLRGESPIGPYDFERRVGEICPGNNDYQLAKSILATLNREGRWQEVFTHMKAKGMNLPNPRQDD